MTVAELVQKLIQPPRLLVVDDDTSIQRVLEHSLSDLGCEVVLASNGEEAITQLAQRPFDAVVLDLRMPIKTGYDVLRWMKTTGLCLPVIVITGYPDEDVFRLTETYGVLAVLVKPFDPSTLTAVLNRYLRIFKVRTCSSGSLAPP